MYLHIGKPKEADANNFIGYEITSIYTEVPQMTGYFNVSKKSTLQDVFNQGIRIWNKIENEIKKT